MDVLLPPVIWIEGRCYRVNPSSTTNNLQSESGPSEYIEDDLYNDEDGDDLDITVAKNGRFETFFHIPQIFLGRVIGGKGATKKRIEVESKTQIFIPKQGANDDVSITGPTRQSVAVARSKIQAIVSDSRKKHGFTHFLSVPLTDRGIATNFKKFKDSILSGPRIAGVNDFVFQKPEKIHLTIAMMTLIDNEDRTIAAQMLQDCQETVIKPVVEKYSKPILTIKGLDIMNDDPSSVHVLYGKVESEPLQQIFDGIMAYFRSKGFMQSDSKIHATLMNTTFKVKAGEKKESFDVRPIMEKYKDFYFGEQTLNEIQLSELGSVGSDGYYEAIGVIKL